MQMVLHIILQYLTVCLVELDEAMRSVWVYKKKVHMICTKIESIKIYEYAGIFLIGKAVDYLDC